MKFAKKPVIVDAVQWMGTSASESELSAIGCTIETSLTERNGTVCIMSPRGPMEAYVGDWIVKNGKFYDIYPSNKFWKNFQTIISKD